MRVLTWNVAHQASDKKYALPEIPAALNSLTPDVVVLTEYVHGLRREPFLAELSEYGLKYYLMTPKTRGENQVLIASRSRLEQGTITAPPIDPSLPTNVLHVRLLDEGLDILGVRVPDYSYSAVARTKCWDWLTEIAKTVVDTPFIMLGDFNTDPDRSRAEKTRIHRLLELGWQHALPIAGASYFGPRPRFATSRIDHAFTSKHFVISNAEYISKRDSYIFSGHEATRFSDHAPLLVDIETAGSIQPQSANVAIVHDMPGKTPTAIEQPAQSSGRHRHYINVSGRVVPVDGVPVVHAHMDMVANQYGLTDEGRHQLKRARHRGDFPTDRHLFHTLAIARAMRDDQPSLSEGQAIYDASKLGDVDRVEALAQHPDSDVASKYSRIKDRLSDRGAIPRPFPEADWVTLDGRSHMAKFGRSDTGRAAQLAKTLGLSDDARKALHGAVQNGNLETDKDVLHTLAVMRARQRVVPHEPDSKALAFALKYKNLKALRDAGGTGDEQARSVYVALHGKERPIWSSGPFVVRAEDQPLADQDPIDVAHMALALQQYHVPEHDAHDKARRIGNIDRLRKGDAGSDWEHNTLLNALPYQAGSMITPDHEGSLIEMEPHHRWLPDPYETAEIAQALYELPGNDIKEPDTLIRRAREIGCMARLKDRASEGDQEAQSVSEKIKHRRSYGK